MHSTPRTHAPLGDGPVLLTGATGFLGMELLARYLERTERTVYALVRARDQQEASARLRAAAHEVVPDAERYDGRLVAVRADLQAPALGLSRGERDALAEQVTEIVHAAASVEFTLPLEEARRINVEGTRAMLELAERCVARGGLRRFSHVSTAYVAGTHRGAFGEDDLDLGQDHRNTYERTKWEAELLVRVHAETLPVQIFRPSIVVGERDSGWTPAFNVIYAPLKAFAKGATLPLMPARRASPVDVVPVDYVADAIFALSARPDGAGRTYSLAAGPQASTVGELIDLSAQTFERRRPLAVPPALYRRTVHQALLHRSDGARRRWLERGEVFHPYFALRARYDTTRARDALAQEGISVTPLPGYFDRLVGYAVTAQWGRRPLTRVQAAAEAQRRRPRVAVPPAGASAGAAAAVAASAASAAAARHAARELGQVRARA
ncbi:SDR family oxidoreductase [Conexibacter woesei]|uniref:Male sterility domain protein n=1 Tax=Conexibacter woesei (strain DSM 14684 / CCUG 47730 / CIP 108061 / JCM 11494 / NBRC 100937 / ID131577) TaxID=469383 RepID=D3FC49_CONWI|nr:SDR family oxidoreductase [Conexibacter woesei]ADB53344.1 Male sterility domain protein [Conexibacter woesei DSM 14684]